MRSLFFSLLLVVPYSGMRAQENEVVPAEQPPVEDKQNAATVQPEQEDVQNDEVIPEVAQGEQVAPATEHVPEAMPEEPKLEQETVVQAPPLPEPPVMIEAEKIEAEKVPAVDVEAIDVDKGMGFDTLGLEKPAGNWLIKRIWWEKAEVRYEKIKTLVDQIMDARMNFFALRNEVESKILDPFYIQVSLNQGQLEEIITFLLNELKRQRETEKSLTPQERQLYEALTAEERTLQQLGLDIEAIRKLDIALDDALTKLMEQINLCRSYEKQAWNAFKDIAKVLDHNKARALYYSMDTYLDNVTNISDYIKNAFNQHFSSLIDTIKQDVERITSAMSSLQEKGIDLRQQVKKLEDQELALTTQEPKPVPIDTQEPEEEEEEPQGWISWMWTSITDFFAGLWDLITFWR